MGDKDIESSQYIITKDESFPGYLAKDETEYWGPVAAESPEEALENENITTVAMVAGGRIDLNVYEIGEVFESEDLDLRQKKSL